MKDRHGNEWVLVPARLTAESGAKSALIGEFTVRTVARCPECNGEGGVGDRDFAEDSPPDECPTCGVIQRQADQIVSAYTRIAELEATLKRQAAAVRMIDMSHVARAETMMQHAQVLHDQSNTAALESERQANAILTERIAELESSITVRDTEIARLETDLELARITERERICAAIKATDDAAAACDYMLDSDDCIAVVRGELGPANYEDAARAGNGGGV